MIRKLATKCVAHKLYLIFYEGFANFYDVTSKYAQPFIQNAGDIELVFLN